MIGTTACMACTVTFPSAFGGFTIVWRGGATRPRIHRIYLSQNGQREAFVSSEQRAAEDWPDAIPRSSSEIAALGEQIERFLQGEPVTLALDLLALEVVPHFQRRALIAEYGIPRGWVSTYGRIAAHLGARGGARAVGNALARNPFPIVIPCHRAVRSDGALGGYQGGTYMKRALLEMEGLRMAGDAKVEMHQVFY